MGTLEKRKTALKKNSVLGFPDFSLLFELDVDSSCRGLCALLSQIQKDLGGGGRFFAYSSHTMWPSERNAKSDLKLEILVAKWAMTEKCCN